MCDLLYTGTGLGSEAGTCSDTFAATPPPLRVNMSPRNGGGTPA